MKCAFLDLDRTVIKTGYRQYLIGKPAQLLSEKLEIELNEAINILRREVRGIMRKKIISGDYLHAFDWDLIIPEALSHLGVNMNREDFDALSLLLEAVKGGATSIYPDSIEAIEELRKDHRVCVMTGGLSKYQIAILEVLGIRNLFDEVLTTDRLGILKVRPEAFKRAMNICKCEKAFHTGDSPSHDVAGAKGAGLPAFLAARDWIALKPVDPISRVELALKNGLLKELIRKDILYGFLPESLMIPDAIIVELMEINNLIRKLGY